MQVRGLRPRANKVLGLLPETARIEDGELAIGGVSASDPDEYGTPAARLQIRDEAG